MINAVMNMNQVNIADNHVQMEEICRTAVDCI